MVFDFGPLLPITVLQPLWEKHTGYVHTAFQGQGASDAVYLPLSDARESQIHHQPRPRRVQQYWHHRALRENLKPHVSYSKIDLFGRDLRNPLTHEGIAAAFSCFEGVLGNSFVALT